MRIKLVALIIGLILLAIPPIILPPYYVGIVMLILLAGIFAMSLNLLMGYGGLASLGHVAFFGVAAYVVAYLALKGFNSFWISAGAGLGASVAIGAIFGYLALRARGIYFMMITVALAQMLWGLAYKWTSVTKGMTGLSGVKRPDLGFIPVNLESDTAFYYFTLLFFLISALAIFQITRSPFGLVLQGIRDSEPRMRAMGYHVWRYQYAAFIIASTFAAIAGIITVYYHGFVGLDALSVMVSFKVLLMVVLGGPGTFFGPLIGAFGVTLLENVVSNYTQRWLIILGLVYVLVVIFAPDGVYGPIKRRVEKWLIRWVP